jgi:hypothetical protein
MEFVIIVIVFIRCVVVAIALLTVLTALLPIIRMAQPVLYVLVIVLHASTQLFARCVSWASIWRQLPALRALQFVLLVFHLQTVLSVLMDTTGLQDHVLFVQVYQLVVISATQLIAFLAAMLKVIILTLMFVLIVILQCFIVKYAI